jgi:hypothetical protein
MAAPMDEGDSGLVAIFGLPAHIPHGLVQQDGHLRLLVAGGAWVNFDVVGLAYFHAHFCRASIDQHPTLLNPRVCLSARAQAKLGHAFVEACKFYGGV